MGNAREAHLMLEGIRPAPKGKIASGLWKTLS